MKRLLFLFILSIQFTNSDAQNRGGVHLSGADSIKNDRDRRYNYISGKAPHGKMVWFTNQYSNVEGDFQNFLLFNMDYNLDDSKSKDLPNEGWSWVYFKKYVGPPSGAPKPIRYTVNINSDKQTIKSVVITGGFTEMALLFVRYWSKPINIDERPSKKEVAWVNSFGDRVTLYYESNGMGKITITANNELVCPKYYVYPIESYYNLPVNDLPKAK